MTDLQTLLRLGKYDDLIKRFIETKPKTISATAILEHLNCLHIRGKEVITAEINKALQKAAEYGLVRKYSSYYINALQGTGVNK